MDTSVFIGGGSTSEPIDQIPGLFILALYLIPFYIIGSIPFGLLLTKLFVKKDIRTIGSGNIGATNVLRTGNKPLAFITLALDAFKVASVLLFIQIINPMHPDKAYDPNDTALALILGFSGILGHCFPIWLKFKGGKGVATTLGVLLAAVPFAGLAACGIWLASAFLFKISSLAALIAIGLTPIVTFLLYGAAPAVITVLIALLVFWRHKENIQRLLKGEEPKIGSKKKS
jgi:glycerol-3-phosphate acyltransferase PlsY